MIPGEYRINEGTLLLNEGRKTETIIVINTGDRPIQVGSHYHFYEVNRALKFDRALTIGMRLDIIAGTAVRFEPGEQKPVQLTSFAGHKVLIGFNRLLEGSVDERASLALTTTILENWEAL